MYLLYLDESGSIQQPNSDFFVMAGISVFERQTHWLETHLNTIAARFDPTNPRTIELHGAPMRSGSDGWNNFTPDMRVQAVTDALHLLGDPQMKIKVFASVIEKKLLPVGEIVPRSFETLAVRFDDYLSAMYQITKGKQAHRGLVIFDKSSFEINIQSLSQVFKHSGHSSGVLRNFAEVPLFIDSKSSRLIQMADLVAYWIYRRYQALDDRGFELIKPFIHSFAGNPNAGLLEMISIETRERVAECPPPKYPFPPKSTLRTPSPVSTE